MTNKINKVIHNGTEFEFESVNGGVTSVNGDTGAVTVNDVKKSATAPSSPTEGMVWYDTTNDQLKVYDGSQWNVTGKEYNAGPGISIGTYNDYSAMQGPAPDGFHVPLSSEWQAVKDIRTALGGGSSDGTNFGIALKLPFAGYRKYSSAGVSSQGTYGYYWSSSRYNANYAYYLNFYSTALNPQNYYNRAYGFSVRCFKNSPTVPTSSWTKLYGTSIEAGGIFWSSTDGLISLSSDGITWITIADKNLGATTVWNSGNTLSEANCGKYYQWGNNYGFPRTGTIANQSTTQVDASNYGPGNYYSSDTFIKYNGRWDSTDNGNLWGGETGIITNAITNTGVLSVNGQTGNVDIIDDTALSSSWDGDTTHAPSKNAVYDKISAMDTTISGKQDTLVSGTNIKTINSNSILGSGNLDIDGLPSQTGQSGKYLTTDGTTASWGTVSGGIENDTTGTTSTVTGIWAGSEAEYTDLSTKSGTVLYFTF